MADKTQEGALGGADSMYVVDTHDWSVGGTPLDPEVVLRVLSDFDRYHPGAVESLAAVTIPRQVELDA